MEPAKGARPTRRRRRILLAGLALLVVLVAAEMFCRFWLGLGDPPLSVADPEIEYLFKPSATYRRFGNTIHYNAWSMRADDFAARKTDPRELRILVLGDSIVNGGALTDQSQLATSLLQKRLARQLRRPVIVGNISAGTWGPPNMLAYLKRHGLFDAEAVVLVLASGDYADAPTFEPIVGVSPDFPSRRPLLALSEAVFRYLPRYLPGRSVPPPEPPIRPEAVRQCMDAIREIADRAHAAKAQVIVAQYLYRAELDAPEHRGNALIATVAAERKAILVPLGPAFKSAVAAGRQAYRADGIHPTAEGQALIADSLEGPIRQTLEAPPAAP